MGVPVLATPRLILREWRSEDAPPFAAVNADPEVMRYIGDGRPLDRAGSDAMARRIADGWTRDGFGLWVVEDRASGAFAGFAGLAIPAFLPGVLPAVEVGWRFGRAWWGRGLATEAGAAALGFAFAGLRLAQVVGLVHPDNAASLRVAAKLGMRDTGSRPRPDLGLDLRVLRIDAPAGGA